MSEDEKELDQLFKNKGGISKHPKNASSYAEFAFSFCYTMIKNSYPKLPHIYFGHINNPSLNATAAKKNDKFYIGVNVGTNILIHDMYLKLFSTKNILNHIGNSDFETEEKKTINAEINNRTPSLRVYDAQIFFPKDEVRGIHADLYTHSAMQFIVLHEIGHIIRGHLDYRASITQMLQWDEVEAFSLSATSIDSLNSQTMEMDADSFATNHAFLLAQANINNPKTTNPLYNDWSSFYRHWVVAIYCFFRLMQFNELNLEEARKLSHPPSVLRISIIIGNIIDLIHFHKIQVDLDEFSAALFKTVEEAEKAYSTITFVENDPTIFFSNYKKGLDYIWEIIKNWNNVRPLLEPFAYQELPPYKK